MEKEECSRWREWPVPETELPGRLELVMAQRDPDEAGGRQGQLGAEPAPKAQAVPTPHLEPLCVLFPPLSLFISVKTQVLTHLPLESPQGQGVWLGSIRVQAWLEVGPSLLLPGGCRPVLGAPVPVFPGSDCRGALGLVTWTLGGAPLHSPDPQGPWGSIRP